MNSFYIIGILLIILLLVIYFNSLLKPKKETKNKDVSRQYEIEPTFTKKAVFEDAILPPDTAESREKVFAKSFQEFKKKNMSKFKKQEEIIERHENERAATERKKLDAFSKIEEQTQKKEVRLSKFEKLGKAMYDLKDTLKENM